MDQEDRILGIHVLPDQRFALAGAGLVDCEIGPQVFDQHVLLKSHAGRRRLFALCLTPDHMWSHAKMLLEGPREMRHMFVSCEISYF